MARFLLIPLVLFLSACAIQHKRIVASSSSDATSSIRHVSDSAAATSSHATADFITATADTCNAQTATSLSADREIVFERMEEHTDSTGALSRQMFRTTIRNTASSVTSSSSSRQSASQATAHTDSTGNSVATSTDSTSQTDTAHAQEQTSKEPEHSLLWKLSWLLYVATIVWLVLKPKNKAQK